MKNYGYSSSISPYWTGLNSIVRLTNDGGFVLVSTKGAPGYWDDVWLIKTDANGDTLWTRTYEKPSYQGGIDVRQLSDGGYIVLGISDNNIGPGLDNLWLIRTNNSGDTLWTRMFPHDIDYPRCVNLTSDNRFIIVGDIIEKINNFIPDLGLIKIDDSGNTLWTKSYGVSGSEGRSIEVTSDGDFIAVGSTGSFGKGLSDVWLLKMDQFGDTLWTRTYGGEGEDFGYCFQETYDGGYIIGGHTQANKSYSEGDAFLIKTNSIGETIWAQSYSGHRWDVFYSVTQTHDGGYIIAGGKNVGRGGDDAWIIRTDSIGDTLWTRTFGVLYSGGAICINQTSDGSFIITGWTTGGYVWLLRIDDFGNIIFEKTYNVQGKGNSVLQASDGGFIIVGSLNDNGTIVDMIKTNEIGEIQWTQSFGTYASRVSQEIKKTSEGGYIIIAYNTHFYYNTQLIKTDDYGNMQWLGTYDYFYGSSITQTPDGGYMTLGTNKLYPSQLYLMKLGPDSILLSVDTDESILKRFRLAQNYPNPFNPKTTIEFELPPSSEVNLKIYNIVGEEVASLLSASLLSGSHSVQWHASNLASGVYLYRLQAGDYIKTRKMILMK